MVINELPQILNRFIKSSVSVVDYQLDTIKKMVVSVKGNAKHMLITQFAWAIPLMWLGTFGQVYMRKLGLSSSDIGNVASLATALTALNIILGGYFADRWGHKKTVMTFDFIAWPASMLIFAFAQNIWWFIAGTFVLQLCTIGSPSWASLFVEHTPKSGRTKAYVLLQIIGVVAGLAMPVAGIIISTMGEINGIRTMYVFGAVAMTFGLAWRQLKLKETAAGKNITELDFNFRTEFEKFKQGIFKLRARKRIFLIFTVQVITGFGYGMWNTIGTVFLTDTNGFGLGPSSITVFPMVYSITLISVSLIIIPMIKQGDFTKYFRLVSIGPIIAATLLVIAPKGDMSFIMLGSFFNAVFGAFFAPFTTSYLLNVIPKHEQSRTFAIINTVTTAIMIPAGSLAGYVYALQPRLVFELSLFCFLIASYITFKKIKFERPAVKKRIKTEFARIVDEAE